MTDLSHIKSKIMYLFNTNHEVHMDISNRSDKKHLVNVGAVITGVYPSIFTVKIKENKIEKKYAFQYVDLLIHTVEIKELTELIRQEEKI